MPSVESSNFIKRVSLPIRVLLIAFAGFVSPTMNEARGTDDPAPGRASMVIMAKNLVAVDDRFEQATAVAVAGNRILAVGSHQDMMPLIDADTEVIRLRDNQTLMPGFIESHAHFVGLGESLMMLDLRPQSTWDQIVADVASAANGLPAGTWIVGRGWHQSKWSEPPQPNVDGYPVHDSLSTAVPDHPVLLTHASGHACFANRAAMLRARIDANTENPPGGEILRDQRGEATGLFRERAAALIQAAQTRTERLESDDQRLMRFQRAVRLAAEECQKFGITSFQDAGSSVGTIDSLSSLIQSGPIGVRLYVMIRDSNEALRENLQRLKVVDTTEHQFTVRAVKNSIDGALGPHGAWLLSPYDDLPTSRGLATLEVSQVEQAAALAAEHGYQMCVHAIGDRANREVLDLYERTLPRDELSEARWRIEHAQHLDPEDIPRFGQLGIIAAMQGVHCTSDAPFVPTRLGYRRSATGAYMWRSLIDSGAVVCNGTDAPVESLNPFPSLYASITRQLGDGNLFFPEQCMTRAEAIRSYTLDAAYAAFEEESKGSITPDKLADLIVVNCDLLRSDPDTIRDAKVQMTILGGKVVYRRSDSQ
jgi:predicted amidohydrolase YtcJ